MCGRFALYTPANVLAERYWNYDLPLENVATGYNITPGSKILYIRQLESGKPSFELAQWGFRPSWASSNAPVPINARIESLKSSYFRVAFQAQRALFLLMDGTSG